MEIMDASIVGLITSAVCIFLLWKFLSCAVISFTWEYHLGRSVILRHQFTAYCPYAVELF